MDAYSVGSNEIEIQTQNARLGEGFNSLNLSRRHDSNWFLDDKNPIKVEVIQTPQAKVGFEVAETSYELTNKLGINAEMAARYANPAVSAGVETTANYVKEESFTNKSFVLAFHAKAISRQDSVPSNPKLNPLALSYLSSSEQLLNTFGDYYCSQLIYGGELVILVTITVQDATKKEELKTKLYAFVNSKVPTIKGNLDDNLNKKDEKKKDEKTADGKAEDKKEEEGSGANFSVEFRKNFEEYTKNTQTKVDIYQVGSYETPKDTTFPAYLDYALNYFTKDHVNNLMRAVYAPLTQLPILDQESRVVLQNLAAELKPAWEKRDTFLGWLGEYQQAVHDYEEAYHNGQYYLPQAYYDLVYTDLTDLEKKAAITVARFDGTTKFPDPEKFIKGQKRPVDFQTKLAKRKIQALGSWGGNGGGEWNDPTDNLTGITQVTVTWDDRAGTQEFLTYVPGGIIGTVETRYKNRDDKDYIILHGTHPPALFIPTNFIDYHEQSRSFSLDKGDFIEAIEVWSDQYVRQVTFWVRRKETRALEKQGPFPPEPTNPKSRWGGVERHYKENIILLGFKTRSGAWIDALGIYYIDR